MPPMRLYPCSSCARVIATSEDLAKHNIACADTGERRYVVDGRAITSRRPNRLVTVVPLPEVAGDGIAAKFSHRSGDRRPGRPRKNAAMVG